MKRVEEKGAPICARSAGISMKRLGNSDQVEEACTRASGGAWRIDLICRLHCAPAPGTGEHMAAISRTVLLFLLIGLAGKHVVE